MGGLAKQMTSEPFNPDDYDAMSEAVFGWLTSAMTLWGRLSSCKENFFVVKVLVALHFVSSFAGLFSLSSLVYIGVTFMFTVPFALRSREAQIGGYIKQISTSTENLRRTVMSKIPSAAQLKAERRGKKGM